MTEPRLEDDIALGINQGCEDCDESTDDCDCPAGFEYDTLEEMYD